MLATESSSFGLPSKKSTQIIKINPAPPSSMNMSKGSARRTKNSFGLEIRPQNVVWKGWKPGGEFTKNVTLKNVQLKTLKIKYRTPNSRFFTTLFPKPIMLSAGTSFTLPVIFKPVENIEYEDKIEFITPKGSFFVSLKARLPMTNLHLPESIHFGLSAVHDSVELNFQVRNLSNEVVTPFHWEVSAPFTITPQDGTLIPGASCILTAKFQPDEARVYDTSAVCVYGDGKRKQMKIEGIGKFPHLLIATRSDSDTDEIDGTHELHFGSVNVHETQQKYFVVRNLSNVKAPFQVKSATSHSQIDKVFHCPITVGYVDPMKELKLPMVFVPENIGSTSIDYFEVSAIGDIGKSTLKCVGHCRGPDIELSTDTLSFGVVECNSSTVRSFHVTNSSDCPAIYQILLDGDNGVFTVNATSGCLPANDSHTITVSFNPPYPINYYRRAAIQVHDMEPLYFDMIGTCHAELVKPPLLKKSDLDQYKVHSARGLTFYPPDILLKQTQDGKLSEDESGCLKLQDDENSLTDLNQSGMDEYFDDGHHTDVTMNPPHVSLNKPSFWLGRVSRNDNGHLQGSITVSLTNHTRGKITAMWVPDSSGVFQVHPASCDVPPMKSTDFRVIYKPNAPNIIFGKQLECYTFYKCMSDFRSVEKTTICPPWLLTLDVCGHTFRQGCETFLPQVKLNTSKVVFPAVATDKSSYKTILLEHGDDVPLLYQLNTQNSGNLTVKSSFGLIRSRYHIISCRFKPDSNDSLVTSATLTLNDDAKHDQTIKLIGTGEQPEVLLSNDGEMYLRPTCIKTSTSRSYTLQNVGRLPLKFKWSLNHEAKKLLQVQPQSGVIHSNELQKHLWTFSPTDCNKYIFKPKLVVTSLENQDSRIFPMRVIGEGMEGELKSEETFISFGCVITGTLHKRDLNIFNHSLCDVHYRLSVEQFVNNDSGEEPNDREPIVLDLSNTQGILPARSHNTICITISPLRRVNYTWTVYYEMLDKQGNTVPANNRFMLCELTADSVYPTLSVTDARAAGSGINISKTQLWRWFSLDHLNTALDLDPEEPEVRYTVSTRHSTSRRPSVYTKSVMDFNFGAAPVDSEPCDVIMLVKNTGCCELEWAFLFPKDLELEMDYWIESGEFTAEELHELHIQDNKLFEVSPKRGLLVPGDEQIVTLTYKHDIPGTHRLPVLLKIDKGKEVLLNFIGVTVELERRYLHFGGTRHVFTPIPIGTSNPLKQLYEMYNGGSVSVIYDVDLSPLKQLEQDNFNHPIFTCLNPSGEIIPGTNGSLEWVFSPLEAKTYEVDIPIHIIGGDTALITFVGIGYDSRQMGQTMPMLDQPPEYTSVPKGQMLPLPGQMLYLSEERVLFGNVPLFSRNRHCIILTNKSMDMPLSYSWHATSEVVNEVLRIDPIRGYLDPGQSALTKITFCAAGQPSFYDLDLICEVTNEMHYAEYESELAAWEKERDRQTVEFVIQDTADDDVMYGEDTEFHVGPGKFTMNSTHSMSSMRVLENVLNNREGSVRLTESQISKMSSKSEVKRFNTLPPIRYENPVKLPSNRSRAERKAEVVIDDGEWPRPTPPKPFIIHLGVTARTHDITEYRKCFLQDSKKHFIDKAMQVSDVTTASSLSMTSPADCLEEEKDTVMSIMTVLLRGLLDDPTVTEAFKDINNDKVPYFSHFKTSSDETEQQQEEESKEVSPGSPSQFMDEILKQDEEKDTSSVVPNPEVEVPPIAIGELTDTKAPNEKVKTSAEFMGNLEDILSLTLSNIMEEALKGEVLLTARPRVVALPPSRSQSRVPSSGKSSARSNTTGGSKNRT